MATSRRPCTHLRSTKEAFQPVIPKEINTKEIPSSVPLEPDTKKIKQPKNYQRWIVHP